MLFVASAAYPVIVLADHQPVTVVLDFVDPLWTCRRFPRPTADRARSRERLIETALWLP
jgi:hypothetical protein